MQLDFEALTHPNPAEPVETEFRSDSFFASDRRHDPVETLAHLCRQRIDFWLPDQVEHRRRHGADCRPPGGAAQPAPYGAGVRFCPFSTGLMPTTWLTLRVRFALSVTRAVIVTERLPAGITSDPPTTQSAVVTT